MQVGQNAKVVVENALPLAEGFNANIPEFNIDKAGRGSGLTAAAYRFFFTETIGGIRKGTDG
jgi:hypothetical protein